MSVIEMRRPSKDIIDACDFCGVHFPPLSSAITCPSCGAPRARWDSYRPAIVSDDYVLSRDGRSYGSDSTCVAAGARGDASLVVDEPIAIEEIAFEIHERWWRIHSLRIGERSFIGRAAMLSRLTIANLRTVLRDRVLLPGVVLNANMENLTASALGCSLTIVGVPLGDKWQAFVDAHAKKEKRS